MAGKLFSPERTFAKFLEKIEFDTNGGCWLWAGSMTRSGYGEVRVGGRGARAHRRSWELHNGPIPQAKTYHGVCVCHRCDNRACVNPAHLFLGTQGENNRDCNAKRRRAYCKGEAHPWCRLSDDDVRSIRALARDGVTQRELARRFRVSQPHIGRILRNKNRRLDFIDARAAQLGIVAAKPKRVRKAKAEAA